MKRHLQTAETETYDVIIVGAGILGTTLYAELTQRGAKTLLLEQDDFGGGASANSLRILHGGLRYLQSADLPRFHRSVAARRWFAREFPVLVSPLECQLLLTNRGLHRPSVLRAALTLNDLLGYWRNRDVDPDVSLANGFVQSARKLRSEVESVDLSGYTGSAVWFDLIMDHPIRVLMEILRRGNQAGGRALNYTNVTGLRECGDSCLKIIAADRQTAKPYRFRAAWVVNATGPSASRTARAWGLTGTPELPVTYAWNVLLDKPPISRSAVAVPSPSSGRSYLLIPRGDSILVGTGQTAAAEPDLHRQPTDRQMDEFLHDINIALPGFDAMRSDIRTVYAGYVPAAAQGSSNFADRPWIVAHREYGGPDRLISAAAEKFTTARMTALRIIKQMHVTSDKTAARSSGIQSGGGVRSRAELAAHAQDADQPLTPELVTEFAALGKVELARSSADVVYRRLGVIDDPGRAIRVIRALDVSSRDGEQSRYLDRVTSLGT